MGPEEKKALNKKITEARKREQECKIIAAAAQKSGWRAFSPDRAGRGTSRGSAVRVGGGPGRSQRPVATKVRPSTTSAASDRGGFNQRPVAFKIRPSTTSAASDRGGFNQRPVAAKARPSGTSADSDRGGFNQRPVAAKIRPPVTSAVSDRGGLTQRPVAVARSGRGGGTSKRGRRHRADPAPCRSEPETTWDDDPLPRVKRADPRPPVQRADPRPQSKSGRGAAAGAARAADGTADASETGAAAEERPEETAAGDGTRPEPGDAGGRAAEAKTGGAGQKAETEPLSPARAESTAPPLEKTITVNSKLSGSVPAPSAAAAAQTDPLLDENSNWLPLSAAGRPAAGADTDGQAWFLQLVSETRVTRPTSSVDTPVRPATEASGDAVPAPRSLFRSPGPSDDSRERQRKASPRPRSLFRPPEPSDDDGGERQRRASPRPRTLFQPDPADTEMTGVFFQSQEDLTQVGLAGPVVAAALPMSPGSIPLPPCSPPPGVPGLPRRRLAGSGRLPGGAPAPGFQPEGFAVRQWQPEPPGGGGGGGGTPTQDEREDWPSLEQVTERGRRGNAAGSAGSAGSAAQLTLRDVIRFNEDGGWWSPPPPPPPVPPPAQEKQPPTEARSAAKVAGGRGPGWPARPREATLEDVIRPGAVDWWEGGPQAPTAGRQRGAELTLEDVERANTTSAVTSSQGFTGVPGSSARPRHYRFDSEGRAYLASPPKTPVLGRSAPQRQYCLDSATRAALSTPPPPPPTPPPPPPPAGRGAWRPGSPAPSPPAAAGFLTPGVLTSRESLRWAPGRGLSRSEPRTGDGVGPGHRARHGATEERRTATSGNWRSLAGWPATAPAATAPAATAATAPAAAPAASVDKCGPEAIAAFRRRMSRGGYSNSMPYDVDALLSVRLPVGFIDSHCHLDFLFKRDQAWGSGRSSGSLTEYRRRATATFPVSFAGCVAVFCDPNYWFRRADWSRILEEPGVWAAFGCHPHSVRDWSALAEQSLTHILKTHKSVVALGEIGLDYSANNNTNHELQKAVFRRQLAVGVSLGLPLVLHVRDAEQDALDIAIEMIPRDHLIHRHCITGNWPMVRRWMEAFPNCYVGLTPLITNPNAASARFLVGEVPLDRLLLETDAPYFVPHCYRREATDDMKFSHPGMALHVAAQVAHMRGRSLEEVVTITAANTRTMYRLPPQEDVVYSGYCAD